MGAWLNGYIVGLSWGLSPVIIPVIILSDNPGKLFIFPNPQNFGENLFELV
jgi:hypothetical protein